MRTEEIAVSEEIADGKKKSLKHAIGYVMSILILLNLQLQYEQTTYLCMYEYLLKHCNSFLSNSLMNISVSNKIKCICEEPSFCALFVQKHAKLLYYNYFVDSGNFYTRSTIFLYSAIDV